MILSVRFSAKTKNLEIACELDGMRSACAAGESSDGYVLQSVITECASCHGDKFLYKRL